MNVQELLNDRGLSYREAGKDYLIKCLNPEHEDTNPSLRIDKVLGIFNCLSCGFRGDIFKYFGAEPDFVDLKIAKLQDKIQTLLNNNTFDFPPDTIFFKDSYRDISSKTYENVQAFTTSMIDGLEDRLVFPIRNMAGEIKGFCGRALHGNEKSKYLFYPKHVKLPLFPATPTPYKNTVILVEGIFDALNMIDKGFTNVVCVWGTTSLLKSYNEKFSHFKILGINKIYILFDGDKAGIDAATKLENILNKNGYNAERIELPEGVDPGSMSQIDLMSLKTGLYNESSGSRKN